MQPPPHRNWGPDNVYYKFEKSVKPCNLEISRIRRYDATAALRGFGSFASRILGYLAGESGH